MKPISVSLIICCIIWLNTGPVFGEEKTSAFRDIKGCFAEASIIELAQQGMIHGVSADRFAPKEKISRLHFAVLMARALGLQPFFPSEPTFTDIPPGTAGAGYVEALVSLNILDGAGNRTFAGDRPIRRQDVAVIIQRLLEEKTQALSIRGKYKDASLISPYALHGVAYVTENGWMNGSGGYFFPLHDLTRAEAAVLGERLLRLREEQAHQGSLPRGERLTVGSGETRKIEQVTPGYPLAFTPVYGIDNPNLCSVAQVDGTILGQQTGTGTVTVNVGSISSPLAVEVSRSGTEETPSPAATASSSPGSEMELAVNCSVEEQAPDTYFKRIEYKRYSGPVGGLVSQDGAWRGFFRQQGRNIIADLGGFRTVSRISLEFKQDTSSGVYLPKYIEGAVSADGVCWYRLGRVYHGVQPSDTGVQNVTLSLTFPPVATRYIRVSFPVDVWVFARHLSVKGGLPATKPVILAHERRDVASTGAYLRDPACRDILLVFTGDKSTLKTLNSNDFMPLVAYLSPQGEIKGRMFDTIQFMPYTGMPCTRAAWVSYLEDLFAPGQQLHALDEAMAKMNTAASIQEKEKVILTLPYPDSKQSDFGSLEPNGTTLCFSDQAGDSQQARQNRFEAVRWYYGELMDRWNSAGFAHLEVAGIYWYKESIDATISGEEELVQKVAQMVRTNGQRFIWIPYYGAPGFENWRTYGFTHVFLQPNYYTIEDPPEDRMDRAAALARRYGTGIELECDSRILTTRYYYDLFYNELRKAHEMGLDGDTPNAYYVGFAKTLLDTVYSNIPEIRKIYDDLYMWISGSYH